MPTYVLPQTLVFQEFSVVPAAGDNPLRAHVSGPHAKLIRYAETDERNLGSLGYYDRVVESAYPWPGRPAGGKVDAGYTKLWMQDALLRYFDDGISGGSVITRTSGYTNRVRSATVSFAANGNSYARSAALKDRDVAVGDVVKLTAVDISSDPVTLWTYVKDLVGDAVAAVVGDAEPDPANAAAQSVSATVVQTDGALNCISATASATSYNGLTSGYVNETYDLIVTRSSSNSDLTTARLRVVSGSGTDDAADVTPSAVGHATTIGTRGLAVTFNEGDTLACSSSATADDVTADDLIEGQVFRVTVVAAFTVPEPTSAGTYTGPNDTIYIVTISRGGSLDDSTLPQFKVSTSTGTDVSGPTTVAATGTNYDVGNHGVEIKFDTLKLRKGDRYYVSASAVGEGAMKTIVLGHTLPPAVPAGSQVGLSLFIRKPLLQIPGNRTNEAPLTNWDVSATELTVASGITAYDESWTDDGVQLPLDVYSEESKKYGKLFVETRYWLADLANDVGTISDPGNLDAAISGPLHPDNPLKWGVLKALENANGTEVKFTSVADPDDVDSWVVVLSKLGGRDDVYHLVPLTRQRAVLDLYVAHAVAASGPEEGLWRVVWTNLEGVPEVPVVSAGTTVPGHTAATTSDGEVALGTFTDDSLTSGSQYTILLCTSGNADFLTAGVRPGDVVRAAYTSDGFGTEEYSEFVVDEVQAEDQLRVLTGPDAPISVAAKFEVWRNLSAAEEAAAISLNAGSWGNRRVRATWPDRIEASGTVMEGYFLNCSLAGLCSGVLPHQGLTRLEVSGYTDVPRTTAKFNKAQLDAMALGGAWIVTQDVSATSGTVGRVFTRHAVTTGAYDDLNAREEMAVRNVDSISYRFSDAFEPFIGVTNVTPVIQARLEQEISILIDKLKTESATPSLGGQLVDATLVDIRPSVFKDRYVVKINATIPYSLNNVEIHLVI